MGFTDKKPPSSTPPRVSVLMAVYNGESYLKPAIQSVIDQTFKEWEFIIVDDGSTDSTWAVLQAFTSNEPRIRIFQRPRSGLTRSLNHAAELATAPILARMDGDDICHRERFDEQVRFLDAHPEVLAVGSHAIFVDPNGDPVERYEPPTEHSAIDSLHLTGVGGGILHPSAMIRKETFVAVGGYDEHYSTSQDYDLWLRLAEKGKLANIPRPLLTYRLHLNATTFARRREQERNARSILERAWNRRHLDPSKLPSPLGDGLAPTDYDEVFARRVWLTSAFRSGYYHTARKHALRVLTIKPLQARSWIHFAACLSGPLGSFLDRWVRSRRS